MTSILGKYIGRFKIGGSVEPADAEAVLDAMITETDGSVLAEVLSEWNKKGIEEEEIYSFAKIMRERMTKVNARHENFVDIVGTGGSLAKTFNVSTAASFIVAGARVPVAKHGNKAATSNSGSSDVLSELGIDPSVDPSTAERCLNEIGICFMFAPNYHRLSPTLGNVRRRLGFPTIFNCVGPLCNPASAPHQLIGVWERDLVSKIGNALARLGTKKSWIVYGEGGLDEISISGPTVVAEIENKTVRNFEISPEHFGLEASPTDHLRSNDANHSSKTILKVLLGSPHLRSAEDIVLINASAAMHIAGSGDSLADAVSIAKESLRSGNAHRKLEELAKAIPV